MAWRDDRGEVIVLAYGEEYREPLPATLGEIVEKYISGTTDVFLNGEEVTVRDANRELHDGDVVKLVKSGKAQHGAV